MALNVVAGEEIVCVQPRVAAGGMVGCWATASADGWKRQQPGMQALHATIEDAFTRGYRCIDLGPGDEEYKHRFTAAALEQENVAIATGRPRAPLAALQLARGPLRERLAARLPKEQRDRLRAGLARARRTTGRP